jgi:hypothetical protein
MREKVALNEAGTGYGDWWGALRPGRERIEWVGAEPRARASRRIAMRAANLEGRAALLAESVPGRVLGVTTATAHPTGPCPCPLVGELEGQGR